MTTKDNSGGLQGPLPTEYFQAHLTQCGQRASLQNERKQKTAKLKAACWNIRTMQDSEDSPQQRSALVARELTRLDIDIAALSEMRFVEQGSLTDNGAGFTLCWSEKNKDEHRLSCVGL